MTKTAPAHLYVFSDVFVFSRTSTLRVSRPPRALRALDGIEPDALTPSDITDRAWRSVTIPVDRIKSLVFRRKPIFLERRQAVEWMADQLHRIAVFR